MEQLLHRAEGDAILVSVVPGPPHVLSHGDEARVAVHFQPLSEAPPAR